MTNPLLPAPNSQPLSPGLNSLLTLGADASSISELARNPVMLAEARQALPSLEAKATAPSGEDGVRRVIGPRLALFPQSNLVPEEYAAWWSDYYDALEDLPESALEAAMSAWVKLPDSEYMPKPGKLREMAKTTPNRAARAYERAITAIRQADHTRPAPPEPEGKYPPYDPTAPRPSKEQIAEILRPLRESVAAKQEAAKAKNARPPIQAQTDETGISPYLRKAMETR